MNQKLDETMNVATAGLTLPLKTFLSNSYMNVVVDANGVLVADCVHMESAELIARACNAHDELLEALQEALVDISGPVTSVGIRIRFSTLEKVKAAIAKAQPTSAAPLTPNAARS